MCSGILRGPDIFVIRGGGGGGGGADWQDCCALFQLIVERDKWSFCLLSCRSEGTIWSLW